MDFPPEQIIRLELSYGCKACDLNVFQELRSLVLNCIYLSKSQLDQISLITPQYFS
jgi:hypothetical protein